jgi:hypothetical protein
MLSIKEAKKTTLIKYRAALAALPDLIEVESVLIWYRCGFCSRHRGRCAKICELSPYYCTERGTKGLYQDIRTKIASGDTADLEDMIKEMIAGVEEVEEGEE